MNTPFGKLIEKSGFGTIFQMVVLVSVVCGALMNGYAVGLLLGNFWLSGLVALVYVVLGVLVLMQQKVMEKWINRRFETAMGFVSCFMIYDFMILLVWGILALAFSASQRGNAVGIIASDILAALVVAVGYWHTRTIRTPAYSVDLGLGEDYRIVLLSDIHLGVFVGEKHVRRMVETVNQLDADLVVISGDIIDVNNHILADSQELSKISALLRGMKAREGIYAALGNHDPSVENAVFRRFLQDAHIRLLHNEAVQLSCINLIGRSDERRNHRCPIGEFAEQIDRSMPVVVLDHDPGKIPEAVSFGADLVLCGHTHKGQFFPVTYFTKWANGKYYFYGHEVFVKTHAVICAGTGFFQLPVRLGTDNEAADIHLS